MSFQANYGRFFMQRRAFLAVAMVCSLAAVSQAAITVSTGGPYNFLQGTVGNIVTVTGSAGAGEMIEGMNFTLGIGDQTTAGTPIITGVDIIGPGTVFNPNNTGQFNVVNPVPTLVTVYSVTTAAGAVSATGTLGFATISTVGVAPGSYALNLKKNVGFPQPTFSFAPAGFTLVRDDFSTDATAVINVLEIPEPASVVMGLFAVAGFAAVAIRRHRARKSA
jgi:hypothetical protein